MKSRPSAILCRHGAWSRRQIGGAEPSFGYWSRSTTIGSICAPRASFQDKILGSIEPGKLADFPILFEQRSRQERLQEGNRCTAAKLTGMIGAP
jgi:predicted amidohydrolase YtcJ